MSLAISPHDRRILIAGFSAMLIIVGGSRLASRVLEWSSTARASAALLVADVTREEASIQALPLTRDSLVVRRTRLAAIDSAILGAETPALSGAELAELVSDAAESTKAQVGNVQVRTDSSARGTFSAVQVQASVTGDLTAIIGFLSKLESGRKLVTLREVGISATADQSTTQARRDVIRADLIIEGLGRNQSSRRSTKQ